MFCRQQTVFQLGLVWSVVETKLTIFLSEFRVIRSSWCNFWRVNECAYVEYVCITDIFFLYCCFFTHAVCVSVVFFSLFLKRVQNIKNKNEQTVVTWFFHSFILHLLLLSFDCFDYLYDTASVHVCMGDWACVYVCFRHQTRTKLRKRIKNTQLKIIINYFFSVQRDTHQKRYLSID